MRWVLILLLIPVVNGFDFEGINSDYFNETYVTCDYDVQTSNYLDGNNLIITLDTELTGYHEFFAEIKGENGYVTQEKDLIVTDDINFLFTKSELLEKGITNGIFDVVIDNCSLELNYPLSYHFSLIEKCNINLEEDCLNYNLNVNLDGTYTLSGELYDLFDNKLDLVDETFNEKEINICFNSSSFLNKELNGPYVLKNILIKQGDKTYSGGSCTSGNIAYYSFAGTEVQTNDGNNDNSEEEKDENNKDGRHTIRIGSSEISVEQENKEPASKITGDFYKTVQNVFLDKNEFTNLVFAGFFIIGFFLLTKFLTFNNSNRE